ncbi:MAG: hypothetical protein GY851_27440, partial [bacterium]|nr:hypothetical protein [bacterium]
MMDRQLHLRSMTLVAAFMMVALLSAVYAQAVPQEKSPANPHAVPNPLLIKVPFTFSGLRMENTPVIFQGRPLLVQNYRSGEVKVDGYYLFIEDLRDGTEVARFGETFSFVSAFVNGDELNVFATENTDDDWTHDIYRFWSTDLKNWNKELVIKRREGEHLFNASVCRDPEGYLMAFESHVPVKWCFRFARSKDLANWQEVEGIEFADLAEQTACANPCIRYFEPYYYCIYGGWRWKGPGTWYEYELDTTKYVTFLARSKDLATWELSPTKYPMLDPSPGEGINNTDADIFEFEDNTYLYYATGNQQEWANIRVVMHPGPMKEFLESYFPDRAPMITFDATEGKFIYPSKEAPRVQGFHGEVTELGILPSSDPSDVSGKSDIDLVAMSRWALRALEKNPRPNLDYECRFSMNLLRYPPGPGPDDHDPITAG